MLPLAAQMATKPALSVALCTFNGRRHLRAQLDSIFNQSRPPDQIVVCDDGSEDGTGELANERLRASRIPHRLLRNPSRLGVSRNFEQAIRQCEGDIVILSDQDDVWRHDKLAQLEAAFGAAPMATLVFSDARVVDASGSPLGYNQWESVFFNAHVRKKARADLLPVLLRHPVVCGATMGLRRDMALRCLPVPEEWLHDEWIAALCAATSTYLVVEAALVDYRLHEGQVVGAHRPTLGHLLATARKMDRDYYTRQIRRFTRLEERLWAWTPTPRAEVLAAVRGKLAYLAKLRRMRAGHDHPYWASTRLLLNGSHHRFELGFRSWLLGVAYNHAFGPPSSRNLGSPGPGFAQRSATNLGAADPGVRLRRE
jgi:glycosyltransferase involved in cell wall biosynthesis